MFCYQCQETAGCTGCTRAGVCGKSARTAALQDLLIYVTRGLCPVSYTHLYRVQIHGATPDMAQSSKKQANFSP